MTRGDALAQARDLKARCYAAWHADPSDTRAAAAELHALADEVERAAAQASMAAEIRALASWCAAVVALTEGRLDQALADLDAAHDGFAMLGLAADAAQTRVPRVMALALLGRFDAALACAEAARDALLALGDTGSAAKVVLNTGSLCMQQDRYAEAAALYRRAGVLFARVGDREHSVLADVGHADALSYLGDLDAAEALYRRAAQRAPAHRLPVVDSSVLQALAELALARGRYGEALQGLEAASRQFEHMALPLQRAEAEKVLADTYAELRLLPEALALYDHVLAALDAQPGSATRPWVLLQRARLAAAGGDHRGANMALAAAGQGMESVDSDAGRAAVALARAELALAENRASAANEAAAEAAGRLQVLGLPIARAELVHAEAEAAMGETAAAQARLQALLALDAPDAATLPVAARACTVLGALHAGAGRTDAAWAAYTQAVALAEAVRAELPGDDLRRGWLGGRADAYEGLLRLALAACESPSSSAADAAAEHRVATALAASERLRARTLRERLGRAREAQAAGDEQVQAEQLRLDWLTRRLNRFVSDAQSDEAPAPLLEERRRLERRVLERARRGDPRAPGGSGVDGPSLAGDDVMPRLAELHATLGAGRALVAYGALDDELFAFVLADGRLTLQRALARWSEVQRLLRTLRGLIDTRRLGTDRLQRYAQLAAREQRCLALLHAAVWQPLAHTLGGASTVFVVPCGGLRAMPFAALHDAVGPLGTRTAFTMLASADALLRTRAAALPAGVVALGDTRRLPAAATELRMIAAAWPKAMVLDGDEATRAALQRHASAAGVLHLACHGEFRSDNPLFSALHLADGALTAMDVEHLVLPAGALVVLGACETALADDAFGDEAIGLVRAFLAAGAAHVLGASWSIDDDTTARWMGALHSALAAGVTVPAAVHAVQRAWIEDGASVAQWAPFILHGG
jgi:tetratricopeptide (TPR) repeat protein